MIKPWSLTSKRESDETSQWKHFGNFNILYREEAIITHIVQVHGLSGNYLRKNLRRGLKEG